MYKPIFNFLGYISPAWYFNLKPEIDHGYFPLPEPVDGLLEKFSMDLSYTSQEAKELDLAWRMFQAGYIKRGKIEAGKNIWVIGKLPVEDEYRFIRKNFHPFWAIYIVVVRLLTFHNPVAEIRAFLKTRNVMRSTESPIVYAAYESFNSLLVQSKPLVSVIIPTLNRYPWLHDVLNDLEQQTYTHVEVIVVDQSEPFQSEFYQNRKLNLQVWYQEEKALWKARNDAIRAAKGDFILLYDDDSRIEPDWIEEHLKALDFFNADISSGVSISVVGAKVPAHYAHFRWSDQLDTGNVLIKRHVFERIGLFDRQFEKQRMGDGEFGLRAYLAGFRNISNPRAKRMHLKIGEGGLRQMGSWDGWRPKKWLAPRPIPSILYLARKYFGNQPARRWIMVNIIPSLVPYRLKSKIVWLPVVFLVALLLSPVLIFQVSLAWIASTKMLRKGAKIDNLNSKA